jgi:mono/diheme cytochrome c family protein
MLNRGIAVLAAVAACSAFTANAICGQKKPVDGSAAAGRDLALQACTGCHIVASDQPYPPIYKGKGRPPEFKEIANRPNVSAAWLHNYLGSLPVIPKAGQMANPDLSEQELRAVSAFIMTLRDNSSSR